MHDDPFTLIQPERMSCEPITTNAQTIPGARAAPRYYHVGALLLIVLAAAALRLPGLEHAPPGLNQDEAANAWNAWCLLKTGRDQYEVAWPILYARTLGEYRSTLYFYAIMPFQALGGLNVWTTRLPAALGGVLTILLAYWIAARLFDRPTGLVAAALLTLSPWHIQLSRLGLEAALAPLLVAVAVAALIWAGFPLRDTQTRPVAWRALLAGLAIGSVCYGYATVRLFLPLFLVGCVVVTWRAWWELLRARRSAVALAALLVGLAATLGPLVYQHLAHPEYIARRATYIWLWEPGDPLGARLGMVAARYAAHFSLDFLFVQGDPEELYSARGFGSCHWYALPLMVLGLVFTLRAVRRSRAARVLLLWLLLYPAGDCLHRHLIVETTGAAPPTGLHMLRSAAGLMGPLLLAALGTVGAGRFLLRRNRTTARVAAGVLVVVVLLLSARFITYYFRTHPQRQPIYHGFHADLVEACGWLRPRVADVDAVFITVKRMNMPYIVSLVALGYQPEQWFHAEREMITFPGFEWEYYARVGQLHFTYNERSRAALDDLMKNGRPDRVIFIVRPGEVALPQPVHTISGPDGEPALLVYDAMF